MKTHLCLCFFFLASSLCLAQKKEFGWLVGTWQEEDKPSYEVWQAKGNKLTAVAYSTDASGNKKISEKIKLLRKGKDFYYVPDVAGPQGEIEFKIVLNENEHFIAQNPAHDFPKKIEYKKTGSSSMIAIISDGERAMTYTFKKIK